MRIVLQRVSRASVTVDGDVTGQIENGLLLLVGVHADDTDAELAWMVKKVANLRVFNDDDGKMNLSVQNIDGGILAISQFTLYGDANKGNRPGFITAARPEKASPMYDSFCDQLSTLTGKAVQKGVFGADMKVELLNDGPVTIVLERSQAS
ncbi:MAG: D-aminoacyl-tRNA deacylase [Planctomycetota bacterium]|jgi:D-tyrosyl-tRNA(Tyr) deacylase